MIKEHDRVVLAVGIPSHRLEKGDVGAVVYVYGDGIGYEVEFVTLDGSTSKVVEVAADQIRAVGAEIPHVRAVAEV